MTWKKHTRTRWIAFLALLGCSAMIVACRAPDGPVNGDDEAAIRNAILNRQAGQNAGDVKAIYKDVHPDATVFGDSWGPLSKPDSARLAAGKARITGSLGKAEGYFAPERRHTPGLALLDLPFPKRDCGISARTAPRETPAGRSGIM